MSRTIYLSESICYTKSETTDETKNNVVTTKVSLKTNFSTPLLVKDAELALLLNPVPLT